MKKWITANYHYMVPEVDEALDALSPDFSAYLGNVKRGIAKLGSRASPVVLGPVSLVRLCSYKNEGASDLQRFALLEKLLPVYRALMQDLVAAGVVGEIQVHEPCLVFAEASLNPLFRRAYEGPSSILIPAAAGRVAINMVSFFEDVGEDNYQWLTALPGVDVLSLDFTRGDTMALLRKHGFPSTKVLGAGLVDGRSVWKANPANVQVVLDELRQMGVQNIRIQPSSSLQFVPWDLASETALLSHTAGPVLAFSRQKLAEVEAIAKNDAAFLQDAASKWAAYSRVLAADKTVANRVASLTEKDFCRAEPFADRRLKQLPGLPILPTTTIGSFPQVTLFLAMMPPHESFSLLCSSSHVSRCVIYVFCSASVRRKKSDLSATSSSEARSPRTSTRQRLTFRLR